MSVYKGSTPIVATKEMKKYFNEDCVHVWNAHEAIEVLAEQGFDLDHDLQDFENNPTLTDISLS